MLDLLFNYRSKGIGSTKFGAQKKLDFFSSFAKFDQN